MWVRRFTVREWYLHKSLCWFIPDKVTMLKLSSQSTAHAWSPATTSTSRIRSSATLEPSLLLRPDRARPLPPNSTGVWAQQMTRAGPLWVWSAETTSVVEAWWIQLVAGLVLAMSTAKVTWLFTGYEPKECLTSIRGKFRKRYDGDAMWLSVLTYDKCYGCLFIMAVFPRCRVI